MKLSVSLPEDDVRFLDEYAREQGIPTRSAVLHRVVAMARAADLAGAYEDAWTEWEAADASAWEVSAADGLDG